MHSCGGELEVDTRLVMTSDPKPRLRWTVELHDRFVDAVTQLGGPDTSGAAESQRSELSAPPTSSILIAQELNDGCNEAMRIQMELQRRLHEQLEVQRHIKVRIEAQSKYLQSILERACNILIDPNFGATEQESLRHEVSEPPTMEFDGCINIQYESLKLLFLSEMTVACMPQITECSMDSCLTSTESPGKVYVMKKRPRPLLGSGCKIISFSPFSVHEDANCKKQNCKTNTSNCC